MALQLRSYGGGGQWRCLQLKLAVCPRALVSHHSCLPGTAGRCAPTIAHRRWRWCAAQHRGRLIVAAAVELHKAVSCPTLLTPQGSHHGFAWIVDSRPQRWRWRAHAVLPCRLMTLFESVERARHSVWKASRSCWAGCCSATGFYRCTAQAYAPLLPAVYDVFHPDTARLVTELPCVGRTGA